MKIKQIHMLDIETKGDSYTYTYGIFAKSVFSKTFLKCVFKSKVPHFWWTEIQSSMINSGIYFEDLLNGKPRKINMGTVEVHYFSEADQSLYGTDVNNWHLLVPTVIDKATSYRKEYEELNGGHPDLTGTGLCTRHEPNKNWE